MSATAPSAVAEERPSVAARPRLLIAVTAPISLTFLRGQARFLQGSGFDVSIVCAPGEDAEAFAAAEGVPLVTVPIRREIAPFSDLLSLWRMTRVMRRLHPDIVAVGTPKAGLIGGLAAWFCRVPVRVYLMRGLRMETARGWKRRILFLTEWIACHAARHVICNSQSLCERAVRLGSISKKRTRVLGNGSSNGVDVDRFAPTPERIARARDLRRELDIPPDAPVIAFVGRFTDDKGIADLLDAFDAARQVLPALHLLLVGEFDPANPVAPALHARVRQAAICQVGFIDPAPYYHLADVVILPSHREGFPNVPLEAAAAAKPVIATNATGCADAVLNGETGLIVPLGDRAALASAILGLLADRERAASMGRAGRARVERLYRREIVWRNVADFYLRLWREKNPAATMESN